MKADYPFSAVVGQDDLKLALLLAAVDPTIGGVLIKGERGTAKSTVARGLAALLPAKADGTPAPFVELPLGATEDRVVGSLDVSKALRDGRTQLRSGVLARADGGVLYVDEVNLLPDHLVDLLLDAAASGWVTIERDGVSAGEAARFVLIGTMNPEEGELRPQFVDRFGLSVQVHGLGTQELRMAAVGKRLEFDANPATVIEAARAAEDALRQAVLAARERLHSLAITSAHLSIVTTMCAEQSLDGIRGDLAIMKAARALAAWNAAREISLEHIRRAAELAMPHRLRRKPSRSGARPGSQSSQGSASKPGPSAAEPTGGGAGAASMHPANSTHEGAAAHAANSVLRASPAASESGAINLATEAIDRDGAGRLDAGRFGVGQPGLGTVAARRAVRAIPYDQTGTLAVNETLTAAATRGVRLGEGGVALATTDLMQHERLGSRRSHVLFLVDASASMATQRRLELAKSAALGLLRSNYQRRDEVALMVFRATGTDLVMPFTSDVASIEQALSDVPTGGRTPLARALVEATELLRTRAPSVLVIFTDGRANVSIADGDPWQESLAACGPLSSACAGALVIDCEPGPIMLGRARQLAGALQAECIALSALESMELTVRIRQRLEGGK
jgi:magnesium chelatase subunit D